MRRVSVRGGGGETTQNCSKIVVLPSDCGRVKLHRQTNTRLDRFVTQQQAASTEETLKKLVLAKFCLRCTRTVVAVVMRTTAGSFLW